MRYNIDNGGETMKAFFEQIFSFVLQFLFSYPTLSALIIIGLVVLFIICLVSVTKDIIKEEKLLNEEERTGENNET